MSKRIILITHKDEKSDAELYGVKKFGDGNFRVAVSQNHSGYKQKRDSRAISFKTYLLQTIQ